MSKLPLSSLYKLFRDHQSGAIIVQFAIWSIPLLLIMGGAIDFSRHGRYKAALSNRVDAAGLALGRQDRTISREDAETYVRGRLQAFGSAESGFSLDSVSVELQDASYLITAAGTMKTMFLPADFMTINVVSRVVRASNRLELALVLDNTGSMNCGTTVSGSCTGNWSNPGSASRIAALKSAAHGLVETLMADTSVPGRIKIGIVPFEGTVNIGAAYAANPPAWVDWSDQAVAKFTGRDVDDHDFGSGTPQRVGYKWLFDDLTASNANVKWEGCVEMRAAPYDLLDTAPTGGDTLFVPFFWGDEPDDENDSGSHYQNDYLADDTTSNGAAAQSNVTKYLPAIWHAAADTSFPFTSGPNYGCPRPILPLTTDKGEVDAALDAMVAYPAMGTFIPAGLVWGWRILSPGSPFTEGVAPDNEHFSDTVKAIVLLTDGQNSVTASGNPNKSIYNGYNYAGLQVDGAYRLGSSNTSIATANLNAKTAELCTNVKSDGIRLYTITFGAIPAAAEDLMRACASVRLGSPLYYHAPTSADLDDVFAEIGDALNELHLAD